MEAHIDHVLCNTPELDSELLDDNTKVLGVLAADPLGQCLLAKGQIDRGLSGLVVSLSRIAYHLEKDCDQVPTVLIDTEETQLLVKQDQDVTMVIMKKL